VSILCPHGEHSRALKNTAKDIESEPSRDWTDQAPRLKCGAETRGLVFISGEPECRLRFDRFGGEPRNADLAIKATLNEHPVALTIEAKADESYGELVSEAVVSSIERMLANGRSNGVARVEQLVRALLPLHRVGLPGLGGLRYQLLTAVAGTLALAERLHARSAILLIHEFITSKTDDAKHESNHRDLERFVRRLSDGRIKSVPPGKLLGPFGVPGLPLFAKPAELYIGKVTRDLRS
jgi:hypothetical protein